jgi:hypothetical protein
VVWHTLLRWSNTGQRICVPDSATLRTTLDGSPIHQRQLPESAIKNNLFGCASNYQKICV